MIMSAWTKTRDDRNFLIDTYAETCDLAAPFDITVDLEFPSFSRLRTLDDALDIVRAANKPNSGILIDTLYLHLSRVDIGELLHVPSELLHFLHVSDCLPGIADTRAGMIQLARDARLYPGEGWIDFKGIIERMPPVHYSIAVSYTHLRAHETHLNLVCRLLLEKKFFLMIRRPPRSTLPPSSAASDVYKRQKIFSRFRNPF